MKRTKRRAYLRLLIVLALLLLAAVGAVVGRYATTIGVYSGSVQYTAKMAESVVLQESEATRQADGTYKLDKTKTVVNNSYTMIPGVDIPKDVHILITGKTVVPGYLYLSVRDYTDPSISFNLCDHWVQVGETKTYVYADEYGNPIPITEDPGPIYILKNDKIYVSQAAKSVNATNLLQLRVTLTEVKK